MDSIWSFFIVGGILTGAFFGRMDLVTNSILDGGKTAMELVFAMAGVVAMWAGVLKIGERAGMILALARKIEPLMNFLFPTVPKNHKAREYIAANFVANFLGLGWAATPAGILAMKELQKLNHNGTKASGAMCMFLTVNMSSLQLLTINVLAYRTQYGSVAPTEIVGVGIVATLVTTIFGITLAKLCSLGGE